MPERCKRRKKTKKREKEKQLKDIADSTSYRKENDPISSATEYSNLANNAATPTEHHSGYTKIDKSTPKSQPPCSTSSSSADSTPLRHQTLAKDKSRHKLRRLTAAEKRALYGKRPDLNPDQSSGHDDNLIRDIATWMGVADWVEEILASPCQGIDLGDEYEEDDSFICKSVAVAALNTSVYKPCRGC